MRRSTNQRLQIDQVSGIICASLAGDGYHFGLLEERYYVAATIISLFTTLVLFVLTTLTTTGHLQANFNLKRVVSQFQQKASNLKKIFPYPSIHKFKIVGRHRPWNRRNAAAHWSRTFFQFQSANFGTFILYPGMITITKGRDEPWLV